MRTRAVVCSGLNEPWKTEEVDIDPPGNREVRVKMVYSGMCHSDEHLRSGDISAPPEVLELIGASSMFPVVGGHEGSGIVTEVGTNVTQVGAGRSRGGVVHPVLWDVPLVRFGSPESVRPRDDDVGRRHDQRRDVPLPPGRSEREPDVPARDLRRRNGVPRELVGPYRAVRQHESGGAHQLRDLHRVRLGGGPGQGQARGDRGRGRVRRRRVGRYPRGTYRRRARHHRGGPGALQAGEGQGDRRHAHGAVAPRCAIHAARADQRAQRRTS